MTSTPNSPLQATLPTVHIWHIALDAPAAAQEQAQWEATLAPDERARAARFRFPQDRRRWGRARSAVRAVLGGYLGCEARQVEFVCNAHGKPMLMPGASASPLYFNWSHSGEWALLAMSETSEVGIDIEAVRADFEPCALAAPVFSAAEQGCLRDAAPDARHALFFRLWTAKEAALKAAGTGFGAPPAEVCVAALAYHNRATVQGGTVQGGTVQAVPAANGFAAALAFPGSSARIKHHTWHDLCRPAW